MARRSILGTAVRANIVAGAAGRAAERGARARAQSQPTPTAQPSDAPANDDVITQIERLAALRASGVLSDDEFASAKAKLLS